MQNIGKQKEELSGEEMEKCVKEDEKGGGIQ